MITDTTFTARGDVDPRVAELTELAGVHGLCGFRLSIAVNLAIWYEDRGLIYDFRSGVVAAIVDDNGSEDVFVATRTGVAVNHLMTPATDSDVDELLDSLICKHPDDDCAPDGTLQALADAADRVQAWYDAELQEQVDGRLDDEYHASGNW